MPAASPRRGSPIVLAIIFTLFAIAIWGAWIARQQANNDQQVRSAPASVNEEADDTPLRDISRI